MKCLKELKCNQQLFHTLKKVRSNIFLEFKN